MYSHGYLAVHSDVLVNIETALRSHRYTGTRLLQLCWFNIRVNDVFLMLRGGNDRPPK